MPLRTDKSRPFSIPQFKRINSELMLIKEHFSASFCLHLLLFFSLFFLQHCKRLTFTYPCSIFPFIPTGAFTVFYQRLIFLQFCRYLLCPTPISPSGEDS